MEELESVPEVATHLSEIEKVCDATVYAEVGFPVFSAIPLFHQIYSDRLRVVQLVRNPAETSASMATQRFYDESREDLRDQLALLPTDPGAFQKHYAERWDGLSNYEKCLFYWTEVHMYGLEIQSRYHDVPFMRVRFEDLIAAPEVYLRSLVEFMGLPFRPEIAARTSQRVDRFQRVLDKRINWKKTFHHPLTVGLAERFGYDLTELNVRMMNARYVSWSRVARRYLRTAKHEVRARLRS